MHLHMVNAIHVTMVTRVLTRGKGTLIGGQGQADSDARGELDVVADFNTHHLWSIVFIDSVIGELKPNLRNCQRAYVRR